MIYFARNNLDAIICENIQCNVYYQYPDVCCVDKHEQTTLGVNIRADDGTGRGHCDTNDNSESVTCY